MGDFTVLCKALYTSLIPQHDCLDQQRRFAVMARIIMGAVVKSGGHMLDDDVPAVLPRAVEMLAELYAYPGELQRFRRLQFFMYFLSVVGESNRRGGTGRGACSENPGDDRQSGVELLEWGGT